MKKIAIIESIKEFFEIQNGKDGKKGYIGANWLDLTRQNATSDYEEMYNFCKACKQMHSEGYTYITEPVGTGEKVFQQKEFNKLLKLLGLGPEKAQGWKKGGILTELERLGIIERVPFDDGTFRFRLTTYGKQIANIRPSKLHPYAFYQKMNDIRTQYVRNRFERKKNLDNSINNYREYLHMVYTHLSYHKTLYWFDLWLLTFCVGKTAYYDYEQINYITTSLRKYIGISRAYNPQRMRDFFDLLFGEFNTTHLDIPKPDKIDIQNLVSKYEIMADYLSLIGGFKKENQHRELRITFIDNVKPPKAVRNNSTDSLFYVSESIPNNTNNHHIIHHSIAEDFHNLNDDINHKFNKLTITENDHKLFGSHGGGKNQFFYLDIVGNNICFYDINDKNKKPIILKDTKHINLKMVKDKMIPHNRQLLKKLKKK
jgi:hypothetical protein